MDTNVAQEKSKLQNIVKEEQLTPHKKAEPKRKPGEPKSEFRFEETFIISIPAMYIRHALHVCSICLKSVMIVLFFYQCA